MNHGVAVRAKRDQIVNRIGPIIFTHRMQKNAVMHMDKIKTGFTVKSFEAEPTSLAEIPVMSEAGLSGGRIAFIGVDEDLCSGTLTVRRRWGNLFCSGLPQSLPLTAAVALTVRCR